MRSRNWVCMYEDKIRTEKPEAQEIKHNKWNRISDEQF
jgi:hypothetical protein